MILHLLGVLGSGSLVLWLSATFHPPVQVHRWEPTMTVMVLGTWIGFLLALGVALCTPVAPVWILPGAWLALWATVLRDYAIRTLGRAFTFDLQIPRVRIRTGPYRYLRHPAYLGSIGLFTGIGLIWGSPLAALTLLGWFGTLYGWRARIETRQFVSQAPDPDQVPTLAH